MPHWLPVPLPAKAEQTTSHVASNTSGQIAAVESATSHVGGLAKLVAPRKGQCVCNGEDEGNG